MSRVDKRLPRSGTLCRMLFTVSVVRPSSIARANGSCDKLSAMADSSCSLMRSSTLSEGISGSTISVCSCFNESEYKKRLLRRRYPLLNRIKLTIWTICAFRILNPRHSLKVEK